MLDSEEKKKFPVKCPHCEYDQPLGDFSWLGIFDDLSQFGKTVLRCVRCRKWFQIREEDNTGPFVTS